MSQELLFTFGKHINKTPTVKLEMIDGDIPVANTF